MQAEGLELRLRALRGHCDQRPEADCPTPSRVRKAFESMDAASIVPAELLAHRRMYQRHLSLPVEL